MGKELEYLKNMKLFHVEIFNEGYLQDGEYVFETPYTDVIRVYGGVIYRTMTKTKQVHTVFVPFAKDEN